MSFVDIFSWLGKAWKLKLKNYQLIVSQMKTVEYSVFGLQCRAFSIWIPFSSNEACIQIPFNETRKQAQAFQLLEYQMCRPINV